MTVTGNIDRELKYSLRLSHSELAAISIELAGNRALLAAKAEAYPDLWLKQFEAAAEVEKSFDRAFVAALEKGQS